MLDHSDELVQFFDAKGKFVKVLELRESWEHDFCYLTNLILAPDGSILIFDFQEPAKWLRFSRQGSLLATIVPKRQNGSVKVGKASQVDASGNLWGHDGRNLLECDAGGIVRERFGAPPDPLRLAEVGELFFDRILQLLLRPRLQSLN